MQFQLWLNTDGSWPALIRKHFKDFDLRLGVFILRYIFRIWTNYKLYNQQSLDAEELVWWNAFEIFASLFWKTNLVRIHSYIISIVVMKTFTEYTVSIMQQLFFALSKEIQKYFLRISVDVINQSEISVDLCYIFRTHKSSMFCFHSKLIPIPSFRILSY